MTDADFIPRYFSAEKQESLLFMLVGAAALLAAWWLWRRRSALRGMIVPLVAIAAIQGVVGATVYFRSDAQAATLTQQRATAPAAFKADESRRMAVVMRSFELYKRIEIALFAAGVLLMLPLRRRQYWFAFGLGLALQAGFMLVLDLFAEARGQAYLNALLAT